DPLRVSVTPQATTVDRVNQRVLFVEQARKRALLAELFDDQGFKRVIVFTRTKRGADRVARSLEQVGVDAASIHGDKSQGQPNHRNGPKRNRNHGGGGQSGHRHEGAPARSNGGGGNAKPAARPAFKGPARGNGGGEQRARPTGVWSNR